MLILLNNKVSFVSGPGVLCQQLRDCVRLTCELLRVKSQICSQILMVSMKKMGC